MQKSPTASMCALIEGKHNHAKRCQPANPTLENSFIMRALCIHVEAPRFRLITSDKEGEELTMDMYVARDVEPRPKLDVTAQEERKIFTPDFVVARIEGIGSVTLYSVSPEEFAEIAGESSTFEPVLDIREIASEIIHGELVPLSDYE